MKRRIWVMVAAAFFCGSSAFATPADIVETVHPSGMLLLGFVLMGLAVVGRRRLR
jgi:hypothetical protein